VNQITNDYVTAFLPCRLGSERVPDKNVRPFGQEGQGLIAIKLQQLIECPRVDAILVSTNDKRVREISKKFASLTDKPFIFDERPEHLAASSTSTDDLIKYVPSVINEGIVLWTHVTSPFIDAQSYENILAAYNAALATSDFDSLMTVNRLQTFIWSESGAVNYDVTMEKWPRTQTLPVWWEVNSGAFVANVDIYRKYENRIGRKPKLHELSHSTAFDIDVMDQFELGSKIFIANLDVEK